MKVPICLSCKHFLGYALVSHLQPGSCQAFPQGIPVEIWDQQDPHQEVRGDELSGIIYEQAPGEFAADDRKRYDAQVALLGSARSGSTNSVPSTGATGTQP